MADLKLEPLSTVALTNYINWFDNRDATNILFKESEALHLLMQGAEAWAGIQDGEIVAVAFMARTVMNSGRIFFAVKPSMRRHGIGSQMMRLVLSEPNIRNLNTTKVNVEPENVGGQKILRKLNFVLVGHTPEGLQEFEKI